MMSASACRVEASEEDAQTGLRSGFVSPSCATNNGTPDAARGHGRASRGEKRQHSSGHRITFFSEIILENEI
jgi:hypothetical protein